MKLTPSIYELQNKIKEIEDDLKNNWSAWGGISDWVRDRTARKLAKIRRALGKPTRIDVRLNNNKKSLHRRSS